MSGKRRNTSSPEPDDTSEAQPAASSDYDSSDDDVNVQQRPQIDQVTGQSGAFPGLANDEDVFYGPAADGIDYLRMVRSERKQIPDLLTAIEQPDEDDGGYWYDGAYTAQPQEYEESHGGDLSRAQQMYYKTLLDHFASTRARLKATPLLSDIKDLDTSRPISCLAGVRAARDVWESQIVQTDPHPVQLACMDADSTLQVINIITRRMSKFFHASDIIVVMRLGAWIWSLLGKCPERGELGSEEISDLRAFAQRAIEVQNWLDKRTEVERFDRDDEYDENEGIESNDVSVEQSIIHPESDDTDLLGKKKMIIDMIITIVGDVYGQRDLLDARKPWVMDTVAVMNTEAE